MRFHPKTMAPVLILLSIIFFSTKAPAATELSDMDMDRVSGQKGISILNLSLTGALQHLATGVAAVKEDTVLSKKDLRVELGILTEAPVMVLENTFLKGSVSVGSSTWNPLCADGDGHGEVFIKGSMRDLQVNIDKLSVESIMPYGTGKSIGSLEMSGYSMNISGNLDIRHNRLK